MLRKMAVAIPLCFFLVSGDTMPDTIVSPGDTRPKTGSGAPAAADERLTNEDGLREHARMLRREAHHLREIADKLEADAARLEERSVRDRSSEPSRETLVRQHQLVQEIRHNSDSLEQRLSEINETIKAMAKDSLEAAESSGGRKNNKEPQRNKN